VNYDQNEFVQDFARRTVENLEFFENASSKIDSPVFNGQSKLETWEVTMLVNSFLGLVVLPFERASIGNAGTKYVDLQDSEANWPPADLSRWTVEEDKKTLWNLLRNLRNAIAHCDLQFHCQKNADAISHITFQNARYRARKKKNGQKPPPKFEVSFKLADIRQFIKSLSNAVQSTNQD